jgi:tRNA(adenine34) deaminase
MELALHEAKKAIKKDCVPIGCVIVINETIIAKAHNGEFWHAEILALQKAQKKVGKFLIGAIAFVTVEPCPMCMHALRLARVKTVIYGASNDKIPLPTIEMIGSVKAEAAQELMKRFFADKRASNSDG